MECNPTNPSVDAEAQGPEANDQAPRSEATTAVTTAQKNKKKDRPLPMQPIIDIGDGGKYIHFGLESALAGESPGLYFKHSDLLQFASIYKLSPKRLPIRIRKNVTGFTIRNL
jgi:hypothetical protein